MGCMLTVESRAICKGTLVRFTEERVEGLVLSAANVDARESKGDHPLQSLNWVGCFGRQTEEVGGLGPKVNDALDAGPGLKDFDG